MTFDPGRVFWDTENNVYIDETQLLKEFEELKFAAPEYEGISFEAYLMECSGKNGTLRKL